MAFDIDANGIVNVTAKDLGTGKVQHITITASTNFSDDEIKKKVQEAEQFSKEDELKKEKVEVRNNADALIYQTEKAVTDLGDKVTEEEKTEIDAKKEDLKKALESDNVEDIKAKSEALSQAFYKVSEKMYQQAAQEQQAQQGEAGAGATDGNDDVVDADYEVVDDE